MIAPPRHPPAYSVAAQMARLHRLGRAHSHEGSGTVVGPPPASSLSKDGSQQHPFHDHHHMLGGEIERAVNDDDDDGNECT